MTVIKTEKRNTETEMGTAKRRKTKSGIESAERRAATETERKIRRKKSAERWVCI